MRCKAQFIIPRKFFSAKLTVQRNLHCAGRLKPSPCSGLFSPNKKEESYKYSPNNYTHPNIPPKNTPKHPQNPKILASPPKSPKMSPNFLPCLFSSHPRFSVFFPLQLLFFHAPFFLFFRLPLFPGFPFFFREISRVFRVFPLFPLFPLPVAHHLFPVFSITLMLPCSLLAFFSLLSLSSQTQKPFFLFFLFFTFSRYPHCHFFKIFWPKVRIDSTHRRSFSRSSKLHRACTLAVVQYRIGPDAVLLNGLSVLVLDGIKLYGKSRMYMGTSMLGILVSTLGLILTCQVLSVISVTTSPIIEIDNILFLFLVVSDLSFLICLLPISVTYSTYTIIGTTRLLIAHIVGEIASILIILTIFSTSAVESSPSKYLQAPAAIISCMLLYLVSWIETGRVPYDLVEAESEIVAGDSTDYAGVVFGMSFISELSELVMYTSLIAMLAQFYLLSAVILITTLIFSSYSGRIMLCRYPAKSLISFVILDIAVIPLYILSI